MKFIKKLQNKTTIVTKEKKLKLNNNLSTNKNLHLNKISKFIIQTNNLISPFEDKHVILKNKNINKNKIIKLRENGKEFINYNFVKLIFKYSDTLFFSNLNYFLKKQYKFKFSYFNQNLSVYQVHLLKRIRFKYESKKIITVIRKITSEQIKIERQQLKELKKFGKKILKDLNYQILITQNLNNYLKINNKVLNYLNYILSLYLDSRNSNYAATNSNCNKSKIIGFDSENLNLNLIKKNNNLVENLTNTNTNNNTNTNTNTNNNTNNNTNTNTTNNNNTNMEEFYKNLFLTKMLKLNLVNKWNLIQIEHTIKSIIKNKKFN